MNNTRKFKYGGAAVAFTVAFIAVVIAFNAVFSALSTRFSLYIDMTATGYYDISEATDELLADVEDEITFIFCKPLDKLQDNTYSAMIYTLAQNYASRYDNVSIDYLNWQTETERVRSYMITAGTVINDNTVIVDCPARNQYRILSWDSFIAYDTDGNMYGFNGELKFTSAILQITGENPVVAFTTNHAEDMAGAASLMALFESAGYTVAKIDLTAEDIPSDARILVSYDPQTDFLGMGDKENEFDKIDAFTSGYGHLMVFLDAGVGELPELYSYLYENWYIGVNNGVLTDTAENALTADGRVISATYTDGETPGASLTKSLRGMQSVPRAIAENSLALYVADGGDNVDGEIFVSPVLTTSENGSIFKNGALDETGVFDLMLLSGRTTYVNSESYTNFVLVSGSSLFAENDYLNSVSCANSDILYAAMSAMGKDKVPDEIDIRKFEDSSLDITTAEANNWTVVSAALIPALFLMAGLVVYYRRKHL